MLLSSALSCYAMSLCSTSFTDQVLLASAHHSEVVSFAAICASLPISQALSWGIATARVSACLLLQTFLSACTF